MTFICVIGFMSYDRPYKHPDKRRLKHTISIYPIFKNWKKVRSWMINEDWFNNANNFYKNLKKVFELLVFSEKKVYLKNNSRSCEVKNKSMVEDFLTFLHKVFSQIWGKKYVFS